MNMKEREWKFCLNGFLFFALFISLQCTTPEPSAPYSPMDVRKKHTQESIDVEDAAVYRKEVQADTTLNALRWTNEALEEEVNHLKTELQNCQASLADLGRAKAEKDARSHDDHIGGYKPSESLEVHGKDDIKFVTKENFKEKINNEKAKEARLRSQVSDLKKEQRICESKMRNAAIKRRSQKK